MTQSIDVEFAKRTANDWVTPILKEGGVLNDKTMKELCAQMPSVQSGRTLSDLKWPLTEHKFCS